MVVVCKPNTIENANGGSKFMPPEDMDLIRGSRVLFGRKKWVISKRGCFESPSHHAHIKISETLVSVPVH